MEQQPVNTEWWHWPLTLCIGYVALTIWLWITGSVVYVAWNWVLAPIFGAGPVEFWPAAIIGVVLFGLAKVCSRENRS